MQCQAEVVNWLFGKHTFFLKYYRQMRENKIVANNGSSIVIYTTEDGNTQLEVKLEQDMVWLTQSQMAELCRSQSNQ